MADKSKTHRTEHSAAESISDMAERARRTGQRVQDEAGQWLDRMLAQTAEWQKQATNLTSLTNRMLPMAQERMEDAMALLEKNTRAGTDLLNKAMAAAQTANLAESQAKWLDFWTASMKALQTNVESVTEISANAIDSWIHFVRTNSERLEVRGGPKAL
jgi:hypothetical protein